MSEKQPSIEELKQALLNSHWPKCNEIARSLLEIYRNEAKDVFMAALKVKRHHVRTAAIEALAGYENPSIAEIIKPYLDDSSYETRMAAKEAIKTLTGKEVLTSRGE